MLIATSAFRESSSAGIRSWALRHDLNLISETRLEISEFRKDKVYVNYYINWAMSLVTGIIPLIVLAVLNYRIYVHMVQRRNEINSTFDSMSKSTLFFFVVLCFGLRCTTFAKSLAFSTRWVRSHYCPPTWQ